MKMSYTSFETSILGYTKIYDNQNYNLNINLQQGNNKLVPSEQDLKGDVMELISIIHSAIIVNPFLLVRECGQISYNSGLRSLDSRIDQEYIIDPQLKTSHGLESKYTYYDDIANKGQINGYRSRFRQNLTVFTDKDKRTSLTKNKTSHNENVIEYQGSNNASLGRVITNTYKNRKKILTLEEESLLTTLLSSPQNLSKRELIKQLNMLKPIVESITSNHGLNSKEVVLREILKQIQKSKVENYPKLPPANGWFIDGHQPLPTVTNAFSNDGYIPHSRTITFENRGDSQEIVVLFQTQNSLAYCSQNKTTKVSGNSNKKQIRRYLSDIRKNKVTTKTVADTFELIGLDEIISSTSPLTVKV